MSEQEKQNYLDRCELAFVTFVEQHPDYPADEQHARQMAATLQSLNLQPDNPEHLALAWSKIKPAEPEPEPVDETVPRLVREGKVTLDIIEAMPSDIYEKNVSLSRDFAEAADYLVKQARATRGKELTWGDLAEVDRQRVEAHEIEKQNNFRDQCATEARVIAERNSSLALAVSREKKMTLAPWISGQRNAAPSSEQIAAQRERQRAKDRAVMNEAQDDRIARDVKRNSKHSVRGGVA